MAMLKSWTRNILGTIAGLAAGVVLFSLLSGTAVAQQAQLLFGTLSGAPKAVVVDSNGNMNVVLDSASNLVVTSVVASPVDLGTAGVRLSGDGDGAITFLGLGNGFDEDLTINLDDASNALDFSSSTGVTTWDANFQIHKLGDATTAAQYALFDNDDTSDVYIGIESATGGGVFTGSATDSAVFGSGGAKNLHLGTNSTVRMTIYSTINSWNLPPQATVPASPVSGDFYVDSSPAPD